MRLAFFASGLRPGGAYDPEGACSYMKAMVTLHYYNYMNMVRLNLVKWLRGLNHRDHQEYKEKCNTSLELIPIICFTSILPRYLTDRRMLPNGKNLNNFFQFSLRAISSFLLIGKANVLLVLLPFERYVPSMGIR